MSTSIATPAPFAVKPNDQFVVSHGKSGALGVFISSEPLALRRGQTVIVQTTRGIEIGAVLCPATLRQARLLGATSAGPLLRCLTANDEIQRDKLCGFEQQVFETSREWTQRDDLTVEILDVDLSFDGAQAVIQFVGNDDDTEKLAKALELIFGIAIRFQNLAVPHVEEKAEREHGGCDKPDCGRTSGDGGGCSTCSTGGGCSSCGSSKTDISQYFGHLRTQMETSQRIPLT